MSLELKYREHNYADSQEIEASLLVRGWSVRRSQSIIGANAQTGPC
jgi:hypothetical protein